MDECLTNVSVDTLYLTDGYSKTEKIIYFFFLKPEEINRNQTIK